MTLAVVTGTRPEIIKMFPIMKQFDSRNIDYKYIHTGQHHDYLLFLKFIEEFGIRKPDVLISLDTSEPVYQVSSIVEQMGATLSKMKPTAILVEGDTNSVLGAAMAGLKSGIPLAHVESGLRSNDWRTVEEHNRRIVDHVSDILFSPTETSTINLQQEHVYGKIHTVGNTVIDAINYCLAVNGKDFNQNRNDNPSTKTETLTSTDIDPKTAKDFILVTIHRSENVDNKNNLKQILMALSDSKLTCVFPIHPRTMKNIRDYKLSEKISRNIKIVSPTGYRDFLNLLRNCRFVITDSGGVQEEITSPQINKRALILRDCTERPESVQSGHSILCKIGHDTILNEIKSFNENAKRMNNSPYGMGDSAIKIADILEKEFY